MQTCTFHCLSSNQGISKGESGLFLTPVLKLWGGHYFDAHVWRRVIVPPDLARSFGMISASYRCTCFTARYPKYVNDLSSHEKGNLLSTKLLGGLKLRKKNPEGTITHLHM